MSDAAGLDRDRDALDREDVARGRRRQTYRLAGRPRVGVIPGDDVRTGRPGRIGLLVSEAGDPVGERAAGRWSEADADQLARAGGRLGEAEAVGGASVAGGGAVE